MENEVKVTFTGRVFVLLLLTLAATAAMAQQRPQWSRLLLEDSVTDETSKAWMLASNGDSLLVTEAYGGVMLRRIAADGAYRYVRAIAQDSLPQAPISPIHATAALDPVNEDLWVLVASSDSSGASEHCNLVRFNAAGERQLAVGVAGQGTGFDKCLAVTVLPDQSVALLRSQHLLLLNRDGSVRWQRQLSDRTELRRGTSLLLDAQQRLLVAAGTASANAAWVDRFELDGTRTGSISIANELWRPQINTLQLLPSGKVAVAGQYDPDGPDYSAGFVALLNPDGSAQTLHTSGDNAAFHHISGDAAGNLYVEAADTTVRALDATGQLRWSQAGSSPAAVDGGVDLLGYSGTRSAMRLSASGTVLWSTPVPYTDIFNTSVRHDAQGQVRILVDANASAGCGKSPALLQLAAADGSVGANHRICVIDSGAYVQQLATSGAGVIANTAYAARAYDDAGAARWRLDTGDLPVAEAGSLVVNTTLLADGGAWVLSAQGPSIVNAPPQQQVSMSLRRLAPDGSVLQRWSVPLPVSGFRLNSAGIVGDADTAVLLLVLRNGVRWVRFTRSGGLREIRDFDLGLDTIVMTRPYFAAKPRRLPSGDVVFGLATERECGFLCPPAPQTNTLGLMRLGPDGAERWRYTGARWSTPFAAFHDDGSALASTRAGPDNYSLLVAINAQGSASVHEPDASIVWITGPSHGRYLLRDGDGLTYAVNSDGSMTAVDFALSTPSPLGVSEDGFLFNGVNLGVDAVLVDPLSLAETARFDVDGLPPDPYYPTSPQDWAAGSNGSWYALSPRAIGTSVFLGRALSRFAVPGSPASDLVFADRFE